MANLKLPDDTSPSLVETALVNFRRPWYAYVSDQGDIRGISIFDSNGNLIDLLRDPQAAMLVVEAVNDYTLRR